MLNMTVGQIVAKNIKTAEVFYKNNIDFCCKGNVIFSEAIKKRKLNEEEIINQINEILSENESGDFSKLSNYELIEEIVNKHHKYVRDSITLISPLMDKLARVHGGSYSELYEIKELFLESCDELLNHMQKEESILFPFINVLTLAEKESFSIEKPHFVTVNNPIARMMEEHTNEGERFDKIQELSKNFTPPEDACNTYKFVYSKLKEFQKDLHEHIHKENNILFPRAIELEKRVKFLN